VPLDVPVSAVRANRVRLTAHFGRRGAAVPRGSAALAPTFSPCPRTARADGASRSGTPGCTGLASGQLAARAVCRPGSSRTDRSPVALSVASGGSSAPGDCPVWSPTAGGSRLRSAGAVRNRSGPAEPAAVPLASVSAPSARGTAAGLRRLRARLGLDGFDWTMFAFALPAATASLGLSARTARSSSPAASWRRPSGAWWVGTLVDRFGRVRELTYVSFGYALCTALTATAQNGGLSRTGFHGDRVSWVPLLISREIVVSHQGA
jgi:hypothetical protein